MSSSSRLDNQIGLNFHNDFLQRDNILGMLNDGSPHPCKIVTVFVVRHVVHKQPANTFCILILGHSPDIFFLLPMKLSHSVKFRFHSFSSLYTHEIILCHTQSLYNLGKLLYLPKVPFGKLIYPSHRLINRNGPDLGKIRLCLLS